MYIKSIIIAFSLLLCLPFGFGQRFEDYFVDKTLRIDYTFGGNSEKQVVLLNELATYPLWAGRKNLLNTVPLKGNGQIEVFDLSSNTLIYKTSFSTLFQEWLSTDLAKKESKSFENVCLVPFPKEKCIVKLTLYNPKGEVLTVFEHTVDPNDVLIHKKGEKLLVDHVYLHKAKRANEAINVVIVAEGYRKHELDKFMKSAKNTINSIFKHSPFNEYKELFNFIAVKSTSVESGVSVPRENKWKNTALQAHFDTFYSARYLTTPNVRKMHDLLAGIPYEHIIVLANTAVYGGGGIYNAYTLTAAGHDLFEPVVVHEFGHSFAGLADEYYYPEDALNEWISFEVEPWEQNITTLVAFENKWESMLQNPNNIPTPIQAYKQNEIGVFQILENVPLYCAEMDCRMRSNQAHRFCKVCQLSIARIVQFYTEH